MKKEPEQNPIRDGVINRFYRHTDTGEDDLDCDYVWIDRTTDAEVLRYDAADPANRPPLGPSDEECLAQRGFDINEEIAISRCKTKPSEAHIAAHVWRQARQVEKDDEQARGEELLGELDLFTYLEIDSSALTFNSDPSKGKTYREDEEEIIKPAMERKGFSRIAFFTGEQDSFGPLSRGIRAWKDDKGYIFYYG